MAAVAPVAPGKRGGAYLAGGTNGGSLGAGGDSACVGTLGLALLECGNALVELGTIKVAPVQDNGVDPP
jgi:hypothetical protein